MDGSSEEYLAREEVIRLEREIAEAQKEVEDFVKAYEQIVGPTHQVGMNRSIWSAPDTFRDPFLDAVKRVSNLTPQLRNARGRLNRTV